jgi:hypothetical protein
VPALLPANGWTDGRDGDIAGNHLAYCTLSRANAPQIDAASEVNCDDVILRVDNGVEFIEGLQLERETAPTARAAAEQGIGQGAFEHRRRWL